MDTHTSLLTKLQRAEDVQNKLNTKDDNHVPSQTKMTSASSPWHQREDVLLWGVGVMFILVLLCMIAAAGSLRGWHADSGLEHYHIQTSMNRFLSEPIQKEPGVRGRHGYDRQNLWYYWRLRPELRSFWTHAVPWLGYTLHLILIWGVTYYAQIQKAREQTQLTRYGTSLTGYNYAAFGLNAIFHLLHFICTHVTYDGLASDVSMTSSQTSVIMALCLIILLEYKERGIFFGWPTAPTSRKTGERARWDYVPINVVRRYHGYAIGWAAIYTCWYHPMENTAGHLMGFFYTWIIMLQGSLMYTKLHVNAYWRLTLEAWVIVHSSVVAAQTSGEDQEGTRIWPRFVFGFSLALVITQIFSLPFWPRLPVWTRFLPLAAYTAVTLWAFSWIPDEKGKPWTRLHEIFHIPSTYYIFFVFGWVLLWIWLKIEKSLCCGNRPGDAQKEQKQWKKGLLILAAACLYGLNTALAIANEYVDWAAGLVVLMLIFVAIFIFTVTISFMPLRRAIPKRIIQESDATISHEQRTIFEV